MNAHLRRDACPGLSVPMQTGDGLLARLTPSGDTIALKAFAGLCDAARRHGNGIVEVTSRGSIQVRGLTATSAPAFAATVAKLGIAAQDGIPVIVNPLTGLDPDERLDAGTMAAELARGAGAAACWRPNSRSRSTAAARCISIICGPTCGCAPTADAGASTVAKTTTAAHAAEPVGVASAARRSCRHRHRAAARPFRRRDTDTACRRRKAGRRTGPSHRAGPRAALHRRGAGVFQRTRHAWASSSTRAIRAAASSLAPAHRSAPRPKSRPAPSRRS